MIRNFPNPDPQRLRSILIAALPLWLIGSAQAQVSVSGFGTIGYAHSDKGYAYQRFVDDSGTFNRDSVLGVQVDAHLSEQLTFVAQGKLSPSNRNDSGWDPVLTWAFLAWRPNNEWLVRLGRFRVPYYLNSANLDVGVTYDAAQLPPELYSISTTNETSGISFSRTWAMENSDLLLDGYWGQANSYLRFFFRDGVSALGFAPQSSRFIPTRIESAGLALTLTRQENVFRTGFHVADVSRRDGDDFTTATADAFVAISPTQGFYPPSSHFFLSPDVVLPSRKTLRFNIFTLGMDLNVGAGFRLVGEYARRVNVRAPSAGADTHGAYLSLQKSLGSWTPYLTVSRLRSTESSLDLYGLLNSNRVTSPPVSSAPLAAFINATQRFNAEQLVVYDQGTVAVGTSYRLSSNQKLKAEWALTHIGKVSQFVDTPVGAEVARTNIQVFSMSYNFAF